MNKWRASTAIGVLLTSLFIDAIEAELYSWTDDQGNVHLSDVAPSDKKVKRYTVDKGCTLFKHIPGMTLNDLDDFMKNMYRYDAPYLREHMKGEYRDLFDDVERTSLACGRGDQKACDCFNGPDKVNGIGFAPTETVDEAKDKSKSAGSKPRSGSSGRVAK